MTREQIEKLQNEVRKGFFEDLPEWKDAASWRRKVFLEKRLHAFANIILEFQKILDSYIGE